MNKKTKAIDELIKLEQERYKRLYKFIAQGVKIIDPLTTYIAKNTKIGKNTVIYPFTIIESDVNIGKNCSIGPFCRIRSGTILKDKVTIGNFVEVVRSNIGNSSKVKHLTYIGDTTVKENVNIGAGTIIANYDGKEKYKTLIKKGAFIGSGSILIAPVKVGKKAIIGAGAVVTKNHNVPDGSIVVGVPARVLKKVV